uniref:Uncharacterized protein n=1 Tax=mine drainage metagenome TaxID=410659 RepID=E6QKR3_9ZZZZ
MEPDHGRVLSPGSADRSLQFFPHHHRASRCHLAVQLPVYRDARLHRPVLSVDLKANPHLLAKLGGRWMSDCSGRDRRRGRCDWRAFCRDAFHAALDRMRWQPLQTLERARRQAGASAKTTVIDRIFLTSFLFSHASHAVRMDACVAHTPLFSRLYSPPAFCLAISQPTPLARKPTTPNRNWW